jgi:methionine--tRNA ligase beta chain
MSISYEDFAKLEIRIGTIEAVELVEGADRLLKLTVEVGEESKRQIISGIREYVADPQDLVGRQCPFLVNLESRTIRGLESQGMILAGGEGETFTLLYPSVMVTPGTQIH